MARYISRAPKKPKKSKVILFLNIVIGLLAAAVIFGVIGFFNSSKNSYLNRYFGDTSSSYEIERGNYAELVMEYYADYGVLDRVNDGYEDAAAVAEYADAAFRYSAYLRAGEEERAAAQKARMEKAAAKTGIYEPELSKIDSILAR